MLGNHPCWYGVVIFVTYRSPEWCVKVGAHQCHSSCKTLRCVVRTQGSHTHMETLYLKTNDPKFEHFTSVSLKNDYLYSL